MFTQACSYQLHSPPLTGCNLLSHFRVVSVVYFKCIITLWIQLVSFTIELVLLLVSANYHFQISSLLVLTKLKCTLVCYVLVDYQCPAHWGSHSV